MDMEEEYKLTKEENSKLNKKINNDLSKLRSKLLKITNETINVNILVDLIKYYDENGKLNYKINVELFYNKSQNYIEKRNYSNYKLDDIEKIIEEDIKLIKSRY